MRFTAAVFFPEFFYLHGVGVEPRYGIPGQVDALITIVNGQQANEFSRQHLAEKHIVVVPEELPVLEHPSYFHGRSVLRGRQTLGKARGEGRYTDAGVRISSPWCGRTSLYSNLNSLKACCCARPWAWGGLAVASSRVRCIRS